MGKHTTFLYWLLLMSCTTLGGTLCYLSGYVENIWESDFTYISVTITVLFTYFSILIGKTSFQLDVRKGMLSKQRRHKQEDSSSIPSELLLKFDKTVESGHFMAGMFVTMGMIGTVIGFIVMLPAFMKMDVSEVTSIQAMMKELVGGMYTALYTTLVGLICSLLLRIQNFNLSQALGEHSNDTDTIS